MIWTGFRRALEITDFWDIRKDDKAENVVVEFEKHWKKSLKQASEVKYNSNSKSVYFVNNPRYVSVLPALCKAFGPSFIFATFLKVFYDVLQFIGPLILKAMIRFIKEKEVTWKGYVQYDFSSYFFLNIPFADTVMSILGRFSLRQRHRR